MASISRVLLEIFENQGSALVRVSYKMTATNDDAPSQRSYRELVQLIGVDEGPGEDKQNEIIPNGTIFDHTVTFSLSQVAFEVSRELTIPVGVLDEDPAPFPRQDEIRARVTLSPLPPVSPTRESNVVRRGGPVVGPNFLVA